MYTIATLPESPLRKTRALRCGPQLAVFVVAAFG